MYVGPTLGLLQPQGVTLAPRGTSLRIENLTAGRYIFRLAGVTIEDRRSGYMGSVVVSK